MTKSSKAKSIGVLTSGGDCPGLNAAIRGVAKVTKGNYGMDVIGILDGFTGLVENRVIHIDEAEMSGLLTLGGTILGTSRNKPHKMPMPDGSTRDMTGAAAETYRRLNLDCLVCIGGGGTAKNALRMKKAGLNVVTLPKTIDNDVAETEVTFGFDSAVEIVTEAIDRLHTTASSHHRIMIVDIMGHNSGWLALASSLAGGADVCLIPELPCKYDCIVAALKRREEKGRRFSLVSVSEGAAYASKKDAGVNGTKEKKDGKKKGKHSKKDENGYTVVSSGLAERLKGSLGIEVRVTTLGHVQRGGIPTPTDRLLATELGVAAARLIAKGEYGVMVAVKNGEIVPVPLEKVAGKKKTVPLDHTMIKTARRIGLCLGDE